MRSISSLAPFCGHHKREMRWISSPALLCEHSNNPWSRVGSSFPLCVPSVCFVLLVWQSRTNLGDHRAGVRVNIVVKRSASSKVRPIIPITKGKKKPLSNTGLCLMCDTATRYDRGAVVIEKLKGFPSAAIKDRLLSKTR